jgi:hypothetical protein
MEAQQLIHHRFDIKLFTLGGTSIGIAEQPDLVSKLNFALMRELDKRAVALKE